MARYEVRRAVNGRTETRIIDAVDDSDALMLADLVHDGGTTQVWLEERKVGELSRHHPHPILPRQRPDPNT